MGLISEHLEEQRSSESEIEENLEVSASYHVNFSEKKDGYWSQLNFSEPGNAREAFPDYTASRIEDNGNSDLWKVNTEENTVVVQIKYSERKNKIAHRLHQAYQEATD